MIYQTGLKYWDFSLNLGMLGWGWGCVNLFNDNLLLIFFVQWMQNIIVSYKNQECLVKSGGTQFLKHPCKFWTASGN